MIIVTEAAEQVSTISDWRWWALVPVLSTAAVSLTIAWAMTRSNRDREAREVHRTVTTGPGGEARSALSFAEYKWWHDGESLLSQSMASNAAIGLSINQQFYVVDASLGQLAVALSHYRKKLWFRWGRNSKHRRLLAWHAGIHIAWLTWYVGALRNNVDLPGEEVPDRLQGAEGRVRDALVLIGNHRTERQADPKETVRDFAARELQIWTTAVLNESRKDSSQREYREAVVAEATRVQAAGLSMFTGRTARLRRSSRRAGG